MSRLPLIEDLTSAPVPVGTNLLVEFDPASQWLNASMTIAAGWLKAGGIVSYNTTLRPASIIRSQFTRLGLKPESLEEEGRLEIWDWYTATLGQRSGEKLVVESLKVQDLSIEFSKLLRRMTPSTLSPTSTSARVLGIMDNYSSLARFNEEKAWVEFMLTRNIPAGRNIGCNLDAMIRDLHSGWVYKNLEAAYDGIADFKLEEGHEETRDLFRIRSMGNSHYDRKWHKLTVGENFEVTLET